MDKAIEYQAPKKVTDKEGYKKIFLAGSIEMGKAAEWQKEIIEALKDEEIIFLNPRRDDWDSSWKQSMDDPKFKEQVDWELEWLEKADTIVMYIDPDTQSPVTLIELGIYIHSGKLIVCCPHGFWKKGNVDIVCDRYNVQQESTLKKLISAIKG